MTPLGKSGEIRDTKTLNLSRNIVSLHVLADAFFTSCDQLDPQQVHLMWVEEIQRAYWLICYSSSKFVRDKRLMKNEQQRQHLLLKVDSHSTFRNNFLQTAATVARQA